VAADRIVLVGNGTDATSSCGGSDPSYVIAVGTVSMRKAQLDLVRAWRPTWPRLLVVGPLDARWAGSNEFVRTVQRRDNVEWLGPLPQQEVWDLQAGAAATLSASRSEGESLALIDSLRLGRPVLLAASPAARALADRYRGGALVYRGGAGLGRALEQLPRAVAPVRRPPSWEDVAARLVPVYERLLGRGTHPQPSATEPAATST
jgi:glycosyltransferase involved in cell wall biosynthesis